MNEKVFTPKFGDFLLKSGKYVSAPADIKEIRGIFLHDNISLLDFSPKKKMYRKAQEWCHYRGGELASAKTLYFIIFHLEEINRIRQKLNFPPLPGNLLAWVHGCKYCNPYTSVSYAVNFSDEKIHTLISSCVLDDCGTGNPVCIYENLDL